MVTVLFYFSKSADKPPGKGTEESLESEDALRTKFNELADIKNWRKVLSNFYDGEFELRGKRYRTAEHAFQGIKIGMVDAEKGSWFTLDSGHEIGRGDGEMARKNRKLILLDNHQISEWGRVMPSVLEEILYAKFHQVPLARQVLIATRDAELWHGSRGVPKARQFELERVREALLKQLCG